MILFHFSADLLVLCSSCVT